MKDFELDRRSFVRNSLTGTAAIASTGALATNCVAALTEDSKNQQPAASDNRFTAVKWGMIESEGSVLDKFLLCKELGYNGMELISPLEGTTSQEIRDASRESGMPVHGVVDMKHWQIRLSDPSGEIRQAAVTHLRQALEDCAAIGGYAVLLVPGKVNGSDETHDDVWKRSIEGIRQIIPAASKLGVRVLIENVWNGFCETPEQFRDYIDEIANPWVGIYFDIGNVRKFGPSEDWIRVLGSRIVKCDVKGWGQKQGFCKIGDGDVNWARVRDALEEIGFAGWFTAEVPGGGRTELADIYARMNRVLGIV